MVGRLVGATDLKKIEIELASYGDAMLSFGYLKRYYFEMFSEPFHKFVEDLSDLEKNKKLQVEVHGLTVILKSLSHHLTDSMHSVEEVLANLDQKAAAIWRQTTPEEFLSVRTLILDSHEDLASLLCGWGARVGAWTMQMQANRLMSPIAQADFIIHNISPGIDSLPSVESLGRLLTA